MNEVAFDEFMAERLSSVLCDSEPETNVASFEHVPSDPETSNVDPETLEKLAKITRYYLNSHFLKNEPCSSNAESNKMLVDDDENITSASDCSSEPGDSSPSDDSKMWIDEIKTEEIVIQDQSNKDKTESEEGTIFLPEEMLKSKKKVPDVKVTERVFKFAKPFTLKDCGSPQKKEKTPLNLVARIYLAFSGGLELNQDFEYDATSIVFKFFRIKTNTEMLKKFISNESFFSFKDLIHWNFKKKSKFIKLFNSNNYEGPLSLINLFSEEPPKLDLDKFKEYFLKFINNPDIAGEEEEEGDDSMKLFQCQACNTRTSSLFNLCLHLLKVRQYLTYQCKRCGLLKFPNICTFIYHLLIDMECNAEAEYCFVCQKRFPSLGLHLLGSNGLYLNSVELSQPKENLRCNVCPITASSPCSLEIHKETYHGLLKSHNACMTCGEIFFYRPHKLGHLCFNMYETFCYYCPLCSLYISGKDQFMNHIEYSHCSLYHVCCHCNTGFRNKKLLETHLISRHPEICDKSGYILTSCLLCPQSRLKMSVKVHVPSHLDEEKFFKILYKCKCNFVSYSARQMYLHTRESHCSVSITSERGIFHKFCSKCNKLKPFNYTEPFCCEVCDLNEVAPISRNYSCSKCFNLLPYDFNAVLDHFFLVHKSMAGNLMKSDFSVSHAPCSVVKNKFTSEQSCKSANTNPPSLRANCKLTIRSVDEINDLFSDAQHS